MDKQIARSGEIVGTVSANVMLVQVVTDRALNFLASVNFNISDVEKYLLVAGVSAIVQTVWYNGKKFWQKYMAVK